MEDLMWIKVETTKSNDDIWSFKGKVLRAVFEGIISNQLTSGYFKLDNVYWISAKYDDYGNWSRDTLHQYGKGQWASHYGELYLKIEHLVSIAPIDGEMELAKYQSLESNHLCVVSPIR